MDEGEVPYLLKSCVCGCIEEEPGKLTACPNVKCLNPWPGCLRDRYPHDGGPARFFANGDKSITLRDGAGAPGNALRERYETVQHPPHYGGDTTYECIKVAEAWGLDKDAYLFNVLKYISRLGKKPGVDAVEDLRKTAFYLNRRIELLEKERAK